jgi:acyl dehydratase
LPAARLGSQSPDDTSRWGANRRDLVAPVPPGATVTVAFTVVAPSPGTHVFQRRMIAGTAWFGAQTPAVSVTVIAAGSSIYGRNLAAGIGGNQL